MSDDTKAIQKVVLDILERQSEIADSLQLKIDGAGVDQLVLLGVLKRLASHDMIEFVSRERDLWVLTKEAADIVAHGSHEVRVFNLVASEPTGTLLSDIQAQLGAVGKIGLNQAFRNKWIVQKDSTRIVRNVGSVVDQTKADLVAIRDTGDHCSTETLDQLKKRQLIEKKKHFSFAIRKGTCFALNLERLETDLTASLVQSDDWKTAKFKSYNFNACGPELMGGHLHPLLKVREEFRQIFFEMGFTEMPTNNYVESSFWNFDALFQPQQHPSRDAHDTFFLKDPEMCHSLPAEYVERTKTMHSRGGFGSIGHRYEWKETEAQKNILRTHTTAVSARMLYRLAQQPEFRPAKYFSIDKVFRNESVDATHLAEFHQIEGLIADFNLTLGNLIGILAEFFRKLGMTRLRFKPAFNPYTEPSMEIFAYHEGLARWIEVGNSGVFRPEMLRPMGFNPNVSVIAWGLSVERPTMIKYQISNIRDLVGHKVDLAMVQENPICRLEK